MILTAANQIWIAGTSAGRLFSARSALGDEPFLLMLGDHLYRSTGGEFQLTSTLDRLRQQDGFHGLVVDGRRYDIGLPTTTSKRCGRSARPDPQQVRIRIP